MSLFSKIKNVAVSAYHAVEQPVMKVSDASGATSLITAQTVPTPTNVKAAANDPALQAGAVVGAGIYASGLTSATESAATSATSSAATSAASTAAASVLPSAEKSIQNLISGGGGSSGGQPVYSNGVVQPDNTLIYVGGIVLFMIVILLLALGKR